MNYTTKSGDSHYKIKIGPNCSLIAFFGSEAGELESAWTINSNDLQLVVAGDFS